MAQVRAAALTNYIEVARFVGLVPYRMLRRARISPTLLDDPDRRIPRAAANFLLSESAREANCIAFGLMMAESRELAHLGAIALVLRHQESVRGVLGAIKRYQHLMGDVLDASIEERGDTVAFRIAIAPGAGKVERQGIELAMGILFRAIDAVSGGRWRPESVHFTHPAPPDMAVHRRVFGTRLVFESGFNGFLASAASVDAPFASSDAELARYAESYLDLLSEGREDASMARRVRRSLELMLPLGRTTLEAVSANLGMPARTLQRLLEREGQSFASVLNAARREIATGLLAGSEHSLAEIAARIGYATPSSFTRWFYGEFGLTPGSWRAGERPAGDAAPAAAGVAPRVRAKARAGVRPD
jgi:AraC-like DNA-binding protein